MQPLAIVVSYDLKVVDYHCSCVHEHRYARHLPIATTLLAGMTGFEPANRQIDNLVL
jgi:hypothetical protein